MTLRTRATLAALLLLLLPACAAKRAPSPDQAGQPWKSLDAMGDSLTDAGSVGANAHAAGSDRENADGGRFLAEILVQQVDRQVFADPAYPVLRPQFPETAHTGLVNPDNLYENAAIRPDFEYLVRGTRGSSADLVLQVYESLPGVKGSLHGVSTLSVDQIEFADDGTFEVHVGPTPREKNWLDTGEKGGLLLVRWSHSDWATERPGRIEIIRSGNEGIPQPAPDVADVAARIRSAGEAVPDAGQFWVDFVRKVRFLQPDNSVSALRSTGEQGLAGQVSAIGKWNLAPDEALVLTVPKADARYQGVQLGNYWFDALEWANRQTSLSGGQARLGSDGRYHYVIAATDPGVPNWLDTTGLPEGVFFLRFQGTRGEVPAKDAPTVEKVALDAVRTHLPADTPTISAAERRDQLAARRLQLQRRYMR